MVKVKYHTFLLFNFYLVFRTQFIPFNLKNCSQFLKHKFVYEVAQQPQTREKLSMA